MMKRLQWALLCAVVLAAVPTQAASLTLLLAGIEGTGAERVVSFDIVMDFRDDPVSSGGFDVKFTDTFEFIRYASAAIGDPESTNSGPEVSEGYLAAFHFADAENPLAGPMVLGTLDFRLVGLPGTGASIKIGRDASGSAAPFISFATGRPIAGVQYGGILLQGVPLPGAVWLLASALLIGGGMVRRR